MAHLWIRDASEEWVVLPLDAEAYALASYPPRPVAGSLLEEEMVSRALLLRTGPTENTIWMLLGGSQVDARVNGSPLRLGIRVVVDRDQISVGAQAPFFFSTENLARVEPFPQVEQHLYCPRCKQRVETGALAVKCPQCSIWHHQSEELPCWTYTSRCALCDQLTELGAGYRWTPEEL